MALGRAINEHERVDIAAGYATGLTAAELAIKYNRSQATIFRIIKRYRGTPAGRTIENYRESLKTESITALHRSLRDTKQIHRAAATALGVMKGIGEFANDTQAAVSIAFEPGALDWMRAKQVGSSSTAAAQIAERATESSATTSSSTEP